MAKGDINGTPQGQAMAQQPKIDQYSVMHKLMDLQNPGGSMAPSQNQMPMPNFGTQQQNLPRDNSFGGGGINGILPMPQGGAGINPELMNQSVAPTSLQDMMRRQMVGSRVFGR